MLNINNLLSKLFLVGENMNIIEDIKARAKLNKKRIILPESSDRRVLEAASVASKEGIADIILIGNDDIKKNTDIDLSLVKFIDTNSIYTEELINKYYELRKEKGITLEDARNTLKDEMYYACMLVKCGYADGVVSGAIHSSADTIRPALQIIKSKNPNEIVSAFFLMNVPNCNYGYNGIFVFADCGLVQDPNEEELSKIAYDSANSFNFLVNSEANVALISHSTYGSAKHALVDKVKNATKIAKEKYPNLKIDGELQVDAAIDLEVAKSKSPNSLVAGHANVLVFPNLDAGNSAYKLVQRLANAEAYGPITQGLSNPVNDLSRGCSINDIVGVIAITALQANNN